jgi:hypothetical protein
MGNEPQPDVLLLIDPEKGGRTQFSEEGYILGGPELAVEVAASSVSIDRTSKLNAYLRNGVCEYLLWRVEDKAIDWFTMRHGQYVPLVADNDGILRSEVFAGLWLAVAAVLRADLLEVLRVLHLGLSSADHADFVRHLQRQQKHPPQ